MTIAKKKRAKSRTSKHGAFHHGAWHGQHDDGYGPFGRPREASLFTQVRLKRHHKCSPAIFRDNENIEVQKKNGEGKWISLGCFDTENEAVDILIDEVEIMETAEVLQELADVGS